MIRGEGGWPEGQAAKEVGRGTMIRRWEDTEREKETRRAGGCQVFRV